MHKRHFIFALLALFTFIISSQHASTQSQIAQDAYAIFEGSCLICHGPDGAYRETLLMEHTAIIDGGTVAPGNPDASELYKRLLGATENGAQMPLGQPQLPPQSIEMIRDWILAGAPDWTAPPTTDRPFISHAETLQSIETHFMSLEPFDRAFARYFTMTHLYNAGETTEILGEYRKALAKLVNSLSWGLDVVNPQPIDPPQTIFYIDLRHYEWDRNEGWARIEEVYPYHREFNAPAQTALHNQLSRLQTALSTVVPSVNVDWFITVASSPPLYNTLLSLPETDKELEDRLEVDVVNNILTAPGIRVWRAGFNNSGVSNHNRVVERHRSRYGAYWKSYDFAGSVGTQNIFTHPLAFTHDGGEIIFNLPNGLQGYYLVDGDGFRLDEAPISIVSNPAASDPTVRNGLSCIGCHTEGMKPIDDQVRAVIESDTNPAYNKAHALQLYVADATMDAKVDEDLLRYQRALRLTGGELGDVEPVSRFHEAFHAPLNLSHAAAAVGLEADEFLSNIRVNEGLQTAGLLVLDGGQIKRDTWTSGFEDIILALDFPTSIGDAPVVDQPIVIPGAPITIPDPNLQAVITEALGVETIRSEDMLKLTELKARDKGVTDLTGIEHARNLEIAWISGVEDLSPIAGLTKLKMLGIWGPASDMRPLANLTNLEFLRLTCEVSDVSPLARLTNMEKIIIYDCNVEDISPLAGMTKLWEITVKSNGVRDISVIANFKDLKELFLAGNNIVDISPIAGLKKVWKIDLGHNLIVDVSPLAGLTQLRILKIGSNRIRDFSPIKQLIPNLTTFESEDNLVFLNRAGPKIVGPWLWVYFSNPEYQGLNRDVLSIESQGRVTEAQILRTGATEGNRVGTQKWESHTISPDGNENLSSIFGERLKVGILYGNIDIYSPTEQQVEMYAGAFRGIKVWLNGVVVCNKPGHWETTDYNFPFLVHLKKGRNILLVAVTSERDGNMFVGFESGTKYVLGETGIHSTLSNTPVGVGDTFVVTLSAENMIDLAGWQFDVTFDQNVLEAVDVTEGDFLKSDGGNAFFQGGSIDNGTIRGISGARLAEDGVSGSGVIAQIRFKALAEGDTAVTLNNHLFGTPDNEPIDVAVAPIQIRIAERRLPADVTRDGVVNIFDLITVARQLGKSVPADSPADVNGDGVVNIFDLTLVAQGIGGAAAPAVATGRADAATIEAWIADARLADDGSIAFRQGIANLESLLATLIPQETALHANYPNPFNPETWIPYQLAAPSEVSLTIYDMNGGVVRRLEVGHQAAGMYRNRSRALYWDGRNGRGEPVASGLYFYTLRAGEFAATRKMLIRK